MGFTFAPPVLEWGWRIQERVCIFGFCFEIFYARLGYEFDLAAGLRLPVEIEFDGVPASVLASQPLPPIDVRVMPLDFDTQQFREFWTLPEGWTLTEDELDVPSYGSRFRMDLSKMPDVRTVVLVDE